VSKYKEKEMSASSVEEILAIISERVRAGNGKPRNLELLVPYAVTLDGQVVPQDIVMAVIVDKLLSEGYLPDGFVDSIDGRIYKYNLLND
jgi:hypothetical protein